jgi:hypothetical protein
MPKVPNSHPLNARDDHGGAPGAARLLVLHRGVVPSATIPHRDILRSGTQQVVPPLRACVQAPHPRLQRPIGGRHRRHRGAAFLPIGVGVGV